MLCRALAILLMLCSTGCGRVLALQEASTSRVELTGGDYVLDPDHAVILWKVNHLGFSTFVGRFETFDAKLDIDPASPEAAVLDVVIDTGSIDSGVSILDDQLKGRDFFDSETHPQAYFTSTDIEIISEQQAKVTGDLTLLGVARPVTFDVSFIGGGTDFLRGNAEILGFSATTRFARSQFGMNYLVPAVGDEVTLEVHLEFIRQ